MPPHAPHRVACDGPCLPSKGLHACKGMQTAVLLQFCRATHGARWLNFEQDLGLTNLPRTLLPCQPSELLAKVRGTLRREPGRGPAEPGQYSQFPQDPPRGAGYPEAHTLHAPAMAHIESHLSPCSAPVVGNRRATLAPIERVRTFERRPADILAASCARFGKRGQLLPQEWLSPLRHPGTALLARSTLALRERRSHSP